MGIRAGKIASQVAHASMKVFFDRKVNGALYSPDPHLIVPLTPEMDAWVNGIFTKIVLGCEREEELLAAYDEAQKAGIPSAIIQDVGTTEFRGVPTCTAVALGPAKVSEIDAITGPAGILAGKTKLL